MIMLFIRASLYNLCFYGLTVLACVLCLPAVFMPGRRAALGVVRIFVRLNYWCEKNVLGLDYEVRGREYLPATGPFVIAAKHQSAYETFKLHTLFGDPAIVLKKELLQIPLWGRFLAKIEPIAINRAKGISSLTQITKGAEHVKEQGRPLVIFPQGTRVYPWQTTADKPYKTGIARIYDVTKMPVIPLALNSGLFWPRRGWMKYPGTVIFEFLPPVAEGLGVYEVMTDLETRLEITSSALATESRMRNKNLP